MLNSLFNFYDRKARLAPVLLCAIPLLALSLILITEIGSVWTTVSGLVLYCDSVVFFTQVGRDRGIVLEPKLYDSWGGKPSVSMLRHSDTRLIAPTKYRYRAFLQSAVPELTLASPEEERINPKAADEGYESAIPGSWYRQGIESALGFCLQRTLTMDFGAMSGTEAMGVFRRIL